MDHFSKLQLLASLFPGQHVYISRVLFQT